MRAAVGDDEMMIGAERDEDKNVSAADSAELAEKEWEEAIGDPIPEVILDFDRAFFNLVCNIP